MFVISLFTYFCKKFVIKENSYLNNQVFGYRIQLFKLFLIDLKQFDGLAFHKSVAYLALLSACAFCLSACNALRRSEELS
jgi:hypothetical protein